MKTLVAGGLLVAAAIGLAGPAWASGDPTAIDVDAFRTDVTDQAGVHMNDLRPVAANSCVDIANTTMSQEGQAIAGGNMDADQAAAPVRLAAYHFCPVYYSKR